MPVVLFLLALFSASAVLAQDRAQVVPAPGIGAKPVIVAPTRLR